VVVSPQFDNFLVTSTTASAALIGLLFVSISIAPDRIFGERAEASRQAQALSSFTALTNIFFISFASLIPNITIGIVVAVIAVPATVQTLGLLVLLPHWRAEGALRRGLFLFLISLVVYGYEFVIGIHLWMVPSDTSALSGLLELILGVYAIGLGRAWELLGAPRMGWLALLSAGWRRMRERPQPPSRSQ